MTPIATAKADYAKHGLDFEQDLAHHLQYGCVFSAPDRFVMGHAINTVNPDLWPVKEPNAWYVSYAYGPGCLEWFMRQAPFPLPLVAWYRNKGDTSPLRIYDWNKLLRKIQ